MSDSILVTYATRYGSTKEVAETVATTLCDRGLDVDIQPVRKVRSLDEYSAIVLGAPLYIGSWLKDAQRFLEKYRETIIERTAAGNLKVALFALGPTRTNKEEWQGAREGYEKELAKLPWLTLSANEMFGGKYDPSKLNFFDNIIAKLPASPLYQMPASDARDWDAIRKWASSLFSGSQGKK